MGIMQRLAPFVTPKFRGRDVSSGEDFLKAVEDYVLNIRDFYDSRARWHRRFYRLSTVLIILIGALLPLGAGLDYPYKEVLLGVSGVAVAALTALRAFYHWDQFWVLHRNTEMLITQTYLEWKAAHTDYARQGDGAAESDKQAALRLVEDVVRIRENEAGSFFRVLSDRQGS